MDTLLSDSLCLKRFRADVSVGAVSAGSIVIHFDVFEYRLSHLLSGGESLTMDGLDLERVKEALGAGIVVAVALGAHGTHQRVFAQQRLVARVRGLCVAASVAIQERWYGMKISKENNYGNSNKKQVIDS